MGYFDLRECVIGSTEVSLVSSEDEKHANSRVAASSMILRKIVIDQSYRAGVGHIGCALSVVDIIDCLYSRVLNIPAVSDNDRDRFVMSKGHAALALYAVLNLRGWIPEDMLNTFCGEDSALGVHPEAIVPGIDFSSGSLGHGLSFGAGAALAAKLQGSNRKVFVLVSDAECNEGSVWEAIMFAAHHQLSNLIVIVDLNGQQAFGYTKDVINMSPLEDRFRAFGFDVHLVDGHNKDQMETTIKGLSTQSGPPHVLIASTVFGKGVSFMERQIKWHYSPLSTDEYMQALAEIEDIA
jgi:transketolase